MRIMAECTDSDRLECIGLPQIVRKPYIWLAILDPPKILGRSAFWIDYL